MIFIFDFDGVLVDSYSCLPEVYNILANYLDIPGNTRDIFVKAMLMFEDLADYLGLWDRRKWWGFLFNKTNAEALEISRIYWKYRMKLSVVIDDADKILSTLKKQGYRLYMVTGCDDTKKTKIERVKASGLDKYFREIVVYGCDDGEFKTIIDAVTYFINTVNDKEIYYIDDKPRNLVLLKNHRVNINLVNIVFKPSVYPYALAWQNRIPEDTIVLKNIREILTLTHK